MKKAMFVQEVTVTDPDTQMPVQVSIYKDPTSGALFGIDSSFVEQVLECEDSAVTEPFNNSRVMLKDPPNLPQQACFDKAQSHRLQHARNSMHAATLPILTYEDLAKKSAGIQAVSLDAPSVAGEKVCFQDPYEGRSSGLYRVALAPDTHNDDLDDEAHGDCVTALVNEASIRVGSGGI